MTKNVTVPILAMGTAAVASFNEIDSGYDTILSPTGEFVLITSNDLKGLQLYDFATKQLKVISTDIGAGLDAKISDDGSTIVCRSKEYKNKLRYTSLKSIDVKTSKETTVVKSSRNLNGVTVIKGTVFAVNDGKMKTKRISGNKVKTPPLS